MAQHIPTKALPHKAFRKIEEAVYGAFKPMHHLKTSMRYIFEGQQEGNDVYAVTRRIPEGIVHGTNKGHIEIHYNPKAGQVEHIFLVA